MKSDRFEIPWGKSETWREVNDAFSGLILRMGPELFSAVQFACGIRERMESLFPLMDELCALACPACKEPCCRVAKLWYNFQDMLFLHLTGRRIPPSQPLTSYETHCRYLGERGCTLHRLDRPWICTWYVCPPQTAVIRRKGRDFQKRFDETIEEIKERRAGMEDAFIRITGGRGEADG